MNTTRRIARWEGKVDLWNPRLRSTVVWWPVFYRGNFRPPLFLGSGMVSVCADGILVQGWTHRRRTLLLLLLAGAALAALAFLSPWTLAGLALLPLGLRLRTMRSLEIRFHHLRDVATSRRTVRLKVDVNGGWSLSFRARPSVVREFSVRLAEFRRQAL